MFDENKEPARTRFQTHKEMKWLSVDRQTLIKLGLLACLGVVLIVAGQLTKGPSLQNTAQGTLSPASVKAGQLSGLEADLPYERQLEQQLVTILSEMKGVGHVLVRLSLEGGNQRSYATNQQEEVRVVEETASSGTVRVSEEKRIDSQLVMAREGSSERPIVLDEGCPRVRGVLVVAEGACDPAIKEELSHAVQVLLGLPAHKVKVMEKEG